MTTKIGTYQSMRKLFDQGNFVNLKFTDEEIDKYMNIIFVKHQFALADFLNYLCFIKSIKHIKTFFDIVHENNINPKKYSDVQSYNFMVSLDDEDFEYLLNKSLPIKLTKLHLLKQHNKLHFIKNLIIDKSNLLIFSSCHSFKIDNIHYTNIEQWMYGSVFNMDSFKILVDYIQFDDDISQLFFERHIHHNMEEHLKLIENKINKVDISGLIKKDHDKFSSDYFIDFIIKYYPKHKFDLTKGKYESYSLKSLETILSNNRYNKFDIVDFNNPEVVKCTERVDLCLKYVEGNVDDIAFFNKHYFKKYYETKKFTNEQFINYLNKLKKHKNISRNLIDIPLSYDDDLLTINNLSFILENYYCHKYTKHDFCELIYYLSNKNKLSKFVGYEKDQLLFLISKVDFHDLSQLIFGARVDPNFENLHLMKNLWDYRDDHILVSIFGNLDKNVFLNTIKYLTLNNKFTKFEELYLTCKINKCNQVNKYLIRKYKDKLTDDFLQLVDDDKLGISIDDFKVTIYKK